MTYLLALGVALSTASAHTSPGRATLAIDNDLHAPVSVWVDGAHEAKLIAGLQTRLSVPAGTREIRLEQLGRGGCVLSLDVLELPRGSTVSYELDRGCAPSWDVRAHWRNGWLSWRSQPRGVVHEPRAVVIRDHRGPCAPPVVVHHGSASRPPPGRYVAASSYLHAAPSPPSRHPLHTAPHDRDGAHQSHGHSPHRGDDRGRDHDDRSGPRHDRHSGPPDHSHGHDEHGPRHGNSADHSPRHGHDDSPRYGHDGAGSRHDHDDHSSRHDHDDHGSRHGHDDSSRRRHDDDSRRRHDDDSRRRHDDDDSSGHRYGHDDRGGDRRRGGQGHEPRR